MRDHRTAKVILACALGMFVGLLIARCLTPVQWCWIGILPGGLLAYLTYEVKAVARAFQQTWRKMVARPEKVGRVFTMLGLLVLDMLAGATWWIVLTLSVHTKTSPVGLHVVGALCCSAGLLCLVVMLHELHGWKRSAGKVAKYGNPIGLAYLIVWWLICVLVVWEFLIKLVLWQGLIKWGLLGAPTHLKWCGRFIQEVYLQIHCEDRLLCLVDTAGFIALTCVLRLTGALPAHGAILQVLVGTVVGVLAAALDHRVMTKGLLKRAITRRKLTQVLADLPVRS